MVTNVTEAVRGRLLARVLGTSNFFTVRHVEACEKYLRASYNAATLVQVSTWLRTDLQP